MLHIAGVLFAVMGFLVALAVMAMFASMFASFAMVIFKGAKMIVSGPTDAVIHVRYPVATPKARSMKELLNAAEPQQSSYLFEDAGGVDLEYRGVGVAQDRAASAALGAAVSKRG